MNNKDESAFKSKAGEMLAAPSLTQFHVICLPFHHNPSSFSSSYSFSLSFKASTNPPSRPQPSYQPIRALDLDENTVTAIAVGIAGVAIGIGIPVFYETQIDNAAKRENTQPCFPCNGSGAQRCRFCNGSGNMTVELGVDEKEVSRCISCDGIGSSVCATCQGTGIQPRYLDRREYKDDD